MPGGKKQNNNRTDTQSNNNKNIENYRKTRDMNNQVRFIYLFIQNPNSLGIDDKIDLVQLLFL